MRDVTDNVTGELPGVEHKRGRGRPRKAHAMTNAERQAAFRARRKAQQPVEAKSVTKRMTVTEMLSDVDAYDECRLEVDQLRAELAEAHETIDELTDELIPLRAVKQRLDEGGDQAELEELRGRVDALLFELREATATHNQLVEELAAAKKKAAKSVTTSNVNSGLFAEIKRSSKYYGQGERGELFPVSIVDGGEYVVQGGPGGQYRLKDVWLWAVDALDSTRRVRLG